ncbi:MAG: aminotransferase class V-fold PLP-dependent enzyme [Ignavibacteriales bacterium]|nr:MAG: aminotransferase class V-fold PLP-dependent enzyme [Ignavibacteriales bacterium]
MNMLEEHFKPFRENTIGFDKSFLTPYGEQKLIYADWIASGRLYAPIEKKLVETFGPMVGNTHSESSVTGTSMTLSYHNAHKIIKQHVNAGPDDVIISAGSGMTAMICKFQRILGLKIPEQLKGYLNLPEELRPVVFITHMEHHSNQTTWLETLADVVVLNPDPTGLVDVNELTKEISKYKNRQLKIGAFTACSNVTGIETPYHQLAKIMHENGGYCFVDFACSAPYAKINMHPADKLEKLDAIFFSPHKFLGGPGTAGIVIFDSKLYKNRVPDMPGGGTVDWTNPWGQHKFVSNIEAREDGGTPAFLQTIKASLCIKLKEQMDVSKIKEREKHLVKIAFDGLRDLKGLHILAGHIEERLGAISFYVEHIHYNLIVKILNDRFGIQVRGGCSCAGTYGHYLLHVSPTQSKRITDKINHGDLSEKPGWVRMSIHPTMTDDELLFIVDAIKNIIKNISDWEKDFRYDSSKNEFINIHSNGNEEEKIKHWFELSNVNQLAAEVD